MDGQGRALARPVRAAVAIWVLLGLVMIVAGGGGLTGSPDWGQGLIFAAPVIALITVVVTAVVLLVAALLGSLDMELGDVWGVAIVSVPLAPITAVVLAFAAGGAILAVPLFVEGFGVGFLLWLGLWWPITIGVGIPLAFVWITRRPDPGSIAKRSAIDVPGRAGPSGSDPVEVGGHAAVGSTQAQPDEVHAPPDADPTFVRALARPLAAALGPRGARRALGFRVLLGCAVAVVLVPMIWLWALAVLARWGRGRVWFDNVAPDLDHDQRASAGVNSMFQLLALVTPACRELLIGTPVPARGSSSVPAPDDDNPQQAAERTLALYRRELGIKDPAVLNLLALIVAYSIAAAISAIAGLFLGVDAPDFGSALVGAHPLVVPVVFGLLAPLASFAVFIAVMLVADRFGRRPGDYSLSAVAVVVPVGLAILLVRLAG